MPKKVKKSEVRIQVRRVGKDELGRRYFEVKIKVQSGPLSIIISEGSIRNKACFSLLNNLGAGVYTTASENRVMAQFEAAAINKPTLKVFSRPGLHGNRIVLPSGKCFPKLRPNEAVCFDDAFAATDSGKFRWKVDAKAEAALVTLSRGNSRLLMGYAHGFSPMVSSLLGEPAPSWIQFLADGGAAKTTAASIISGEFGRHIDPEKASRYGSGESFNGTINELERLLPAHSGQLLFLDETKALGGGSPQGSSAQLELLFRASSGQTKARYKEQRPQTFNVAILTTSNVSTVEQGKSAKREVGGAEFDRQIDIPAPHSGSGMFDTLHGRESIGALVGEMLELRRRHYGVNARRFARRLAAELKRDRKGLIGWLKRRVQFYIKAHGPKVAALDPARNLGRLNRRFAVAYATGCLLTRLHLYPYSRTEWGRAISSCHRDHVSLVAQESKRLQVRAIDQIKAWVAGFPGGIPTRSEFLARQAQWPWPSIPLACWSNDPGEGDLWIDERTLVKVLGSKEAAAQLKRDLRAKDQIHVTKGGKSGEKFATKRRAPWGKGKRVYVVAIDAAALNG